MVSSARAIETAPQKRLRLFPVRFISTRLTCGKQERYPSGGIESHYKYRVVTFHGLTGISIWANRSVRGRVQSLHTKRFITEGIILRHWCYRSSSVSRSRQRKFMETDGSKILRRPQTENPQIVLALIHR